MHILLIHQAFTALDEAGGTRHFELAQYLIQKGHRITVITSPVSYLTGKSKLDSPRWVVQENPIQGMTVLRTYTYPAIHRSFFHRIFSFISFMVSSFLVGLNVKDVDMVWGTTPPIFQCMTALLLARIKRTPFLMEVRDLWPAFAIAVGVLKNKLIIGASNCLEKFLYKNADTVMVNSPGYLSHVRQKGAKNVQLVPNGVNPSMFSPLSTGELTRRKYNLLNKFIVLYTGAFGLSNDLSIILQAAQILKDQTSISFVLVGDGKEKSNLLSYSEELGLSNVLFLPPVAKKEMEDIFAASNLCIAILKPVELYKTTYPNKVFDYMAAGRPVLCAIDGVIRKVIEDGKAGIAVPPGDPQKMSEAILQLFHSPDEASRMGQSGRSYVEKYFNRADTANQLEVIMNNMRRSNG